LGNNPGAVIAEIYCNSNSATRRRQAGPMLRSAISSTANFAFLLIEVGYCQRQQLKPGGNMASKQENAGEKLLDFFNQLTYETIDAMDDVYAKDIQFCDPVRRFNSLQDLKAYMAAQYKHVISCRFESVVSTHEKSLSLIEWNMFLRHKVLNLGQEIKISGVSIVRMNDDGLISEHRDYFDVSRFLLKSVPGVGAITEAIKRTFASL
jgi:hypothetical protein